jgi:hypothetical protein
MKTLNHRGFIVPYLFKVTLNLAISDSCHFHYLFVYLVYNYFFYQLASHTTNIWSISSVHH